MIQKIQAYKSSDGTAHSTLEEAQKFELRKLFETVDKLQFSDVGKQEAVVIIMSQRDKFMDILTTTATSIPKARRVNGGTKKRTPKHIADQHTLPLDQPKDAA